MESITSSKLFRTRQGTLVLGVVVAVLAAIVLLVYLNHYRNSVNQNTAPISVLVAQKLIQVGTPGNVIRDTPGYYKPTATAKNDVSTGAIVDPGALAGLEATTEISPGQQLTTADFGPATNSVTDQLSRGERAVVVPLGSPQTVGGQIGAGSHVDVWVTVNGTVRELYQNMSVLGLDGGNVTLEATPKQAGALIFASQSAPMWLVLRPTIGSIQRVPAINLNNLFRTGG